MRLPVLPSPPPPPAEDLYEIRERPPVTPARFVRARNLPPMIIPPKKRPKSDTGVTNSAPQARVQTVAVGEERRRGDRRTAQLPVLLDTRTGRDRRHRDDGTAGGGSGVDVEA
jgi:hypothetical protein